VYLLLLLTRSRARQRQIFLYVRSFLSLIFGHNLNNGNSHTIRISGRSVMYLIEISSVDITAMYVCRQERRLRVEFAPAGSHRGVSDCRCCYYSWRYIADTAHQTESCL